MVGMAAQLKIGKKVTGDCVIAHDVVQKDEWEQKVRMARCLVALRSSKCRTMPRECKLRW